MKPDGVTNLPPLKDQIYVKECAKIIRAILKQAFPRTSFSVKLDRYSMGHCIDVRWTDGPATKQVQPILDRFVSSGFDGMTDCSYSCGERLWNGVQVDVDGGHVRGTRSQSARNFSYFWSSLSLGSGSRIIATESMNSTRISFCVSAISVTVSFELGCATKLPVSLVSPDVHRA